MAKSTIKPSVGRIVIYVWPAERREKKNNGAETSPAIIVRTWEETSYENDECNLKVLSDGENDEWQTSVPYSESNIPDTWHWPPRS